MNYETVVDKETKLEYQVISTIKGENAQECPVCSQDRKKKKVKCFSYNTEKNQGRCNHCGAVMYKKSENTKVYKRPPDWVNNTDLDDSVVEWFLKRNISRQTLIDMKITQGQQFMPQAGENRKVMQFNYFRGGKLINVKSRDRDKNFLLFKDGEKIFYNLDGIKDADEIYIVEGEIDALTMIQAGYKNTVSVPNGGVDKGENNLEYLDNCWEPFEKATKVYLLTDHDMPGEKLANELARRIGVEKCHRVLLGEYKDVNEQLCKTSKVDVSQTKPFPIEGVFGVDDHWGAFNQIRINGYPKGWKPRGALGELITFHPGYTTIVTGIPGHGKSEVVDQMVLEISLDHDLRGGFFTPENWPTEVHIIKLVEKIVGKSIFRGSPTHATDMDLEKAREFMRERLFWIYPEENYSLPTVLDKIRQAVLKHGIRWFVIDPWNKLEHHDDSTGYISMCLDMISNFTKKTGTHAFIVAHPTKMKMDYQSGKYEVPDLYSISGSANFYNKADIGICVYKDEKYRNSVIVQKVKFKFWGEQGRVQYIWDPTNGRYNESAIPDTRNWLTPNSEQAKMEFPPPNFKPIKDLLPPSKDQYHLELPPPVDEDDNLPF